MPSQPHLFGEFDDLPPPANTARGDDRHSTRVGRGVGPAAPDEAVQAIAARLPAGIYLGTSSWSYPGWKGIVYDPASPDNQIARKGLKAYAQHPLMRSVGIDRTFYAPITASDFAAYAAQVPREFRFLVKAPMAITSTYLRDEHGRYADSPHYLDADYTIREFIHPCLEGLGETAGPLVFQFTPQGRDVTRAPDAFINRLYRFLKALPVGPLYAVEIRDPELMTKRFFMCLKTTGVHFCVAAHANMPPIDKQIEAMRECMDVGPFIARWSLHSGFRYADAKARYAPFDRLIDEDPQSRHTLAQACLHAVALGQSAFVIVNNKAEGSSPLSIVKLAAAIGDA